MNQDKTLNELCAEAASLLPDVFREWQAPALFVQCGSGFKPDFLFDAPPQAILLNRLPGMPHHRTPDNEHPALLYGLINNIPVLATRGHRHLYEGCGTLPCVLPLCVAHRAGVSTVIVVDSGLSLRKELKPGMWLLLTDFINGHHCSPLDGNHTMLPEPFPDMTEALSQHLNSELMNALADVGISPRLGVFMSRPGSQFCTVSEANAARSYGADIVGHDIVMEVIMGHALGCKVAAFALAALNAPDYYARLKLKRNDILEACGFCSRDLFRGLRKGIRSFLE